MERMKEMRKCARKEAGERGGSKTECELNKKYHMQISNLTTIIMELSICSYILFSWIQSLDTRPCP